MKPPNNSKEPLRLDSVVFNSNNSNARPKLKDVPERYKRKGNRPPEWKAGRRAVASKAVVAAPSLVVQQHAAREAAVLIVGLGNEIRL